MDDNCRTIEIYWTDLTQEAKKRIAQAMGDPDGASDETFNNWDLYPMAIMDIQEVEA